MSREDIQESVESVRKAESLGQYLTAADRAREALAEFDDELEKPERTLLRYLQVRSMARGGATGAAAELYESYDLGSVREPDYQSLQGAYPQGSGVLQHSVIIAPRTWQRRGARL